MYKISTTSQITDRSLIYLPECHSTNEVMYEMAATGLLIEGDIVITDHQYAGKGQGGNRWLSPPGQNLTFSMFFQPRHIPAEKNFLLNIMISLALTDWLGIIHSRDFKIKWPNDIIHAGRKIAGILIRNRVGSGKIKSSVAGIGINVNQVAFPEDLKAASLRSISGISYDLNQVFNGLVERLDSRYRQSRELKPEKLKTEYLNRLLGMNERMEFQTGEKVINGIIRDVEAEGRLVVEVDGRRVSFRNREIRLLMEDQDG